MNLKINDVIYNISVEGEGEPLVFLHGFTGSISSWYEIVSKMQNEYRCILIDIIGHGNTESPVQFSRYGLEMVAKDIVSILDRLRIDKTNLLGYSMGGRLALATALLYEERFNRLILESSSPGLRTKVEQQARLISDEALAAKIEKEGIRSFIEYWEGIPLFSSQKKLSNERKNRLKAQRLQNNVVGLANSLRGMGTGAQTSYWAMLSRLSIPTLLLCGEKDQKFCEIAEMMKREIVNSQVVKIMNAGHAIHVEQPQFFGKIVSEFLKGQEIDHLI